MPGDQGEAAEVGIGEEVNELEVDVGDILSEVDDQANAADLDKYDDHQIDEDLAEIGIDDKEFLEALEADHQDNEI